MYYVYKHICPNNKVYIGITKNINNRWRKDGSGYSTQLFGRAINKYGWENITHEILNEVETLEEANDLERKYIAEYKSNNPNYGYNITAGGDGTVGVKPTAEQRAKMSERNKARWADKDYYEKHIYQIKLMNDALRGKPKSEETRRKISEANKGRKCDYLKTEEHRRIFIEKCKSKSYTKEAIEKRRQAAIGRPLSKEHAAKCGLAHRKPVNQYDLDGNFIKRWDYIAQTVPEIGKAQKEISQCCRGERPYARDYIWRYVGSPLEVKPVSKKVRGKAVIQLKDGIEIARYQKITDAAKAVGTDVSQISCVCKGKGKTVKGYVWRYANE